MTYLLIYLLRNHKNIYDARKKTLPENPSTTLLQTYLCNTQSFTEYIGTRIQNKPFPLINYEKTHISFLHVQIHEHVVIMQSK